MPNQVQSSTPQLRAAVIDCGTNVFTMLIGEGTHEGWRTQLVLRQPVFIGRGGFQSRIIVPDRFARGIDALKVFHQACKNFNVTHVKVAGTSALRDANNGQRFAQCVRDQLDWQIEIIDGEQEAQWIHDGVALTLPNQWSSPILIMDIGGGSVEFILSDWSTSGEWKALEKLSIDVGVGRLEEFGKPNDPLLASGEQRYHEFMDELMRPVVDVIHRYQPKALIGSSGSFDTFVEIIDGALPAWNSKRAAEIHEIDRVKLKAVHQQLITLSLKDRLAIPGMSPVRAHLIPLSSMLVQWVLGIMPDDSKAFRSPYAMREGIMNSFWQHLCKDGAQGAGASENS
ncbi:MAG: hypothetical protein ACO3MV_06220 [Flavobacteriales bacterium]